MRVLVPVLVLAVLGCAGGSDGFLTDEQRYTDQEALVRFEAHVGSVPEGAADATYVAGGFQDPFAEAEFRAPEDAAVAWFDALVLPCDTAEDTSGSHPQFGLSHPKGEGWRTKRCQKADGTSYTVQLEPSGETRWVVLHWYTT